MGIDRRDVGAKTDGEVGSERRERAGAQRDGRRERDDSRDDWAMQ
jgi:hypothetical protein